MSYDLETLLLVGAAIAAVLVMLAIVRKIASSRPTRRRPGGIETHSVKECPSCGWKGAVSKYHKKCSNCGEDLA